MIKKLIRRIIVRIFNLVGYNVAFSKKSISSMINIDKNVWEPNYNPDHKMKLYYEGLINSGSEESDGFIKQLRLYSMQNLVYHILRLGLKGDFVECGVWKGHSAYIISRILSVNDFSGEFHIFDSFEGGLSKKVEKDKNLRRILNEKQIKLESDVFITTEDEVRSCLGDFDFIRIYKGWIPDRFNEVENKKFQFININVDLYEPTKDSLEFFYPRLVENGVVICNDYGSCKFPGSKKAVSEFLKDNRYNMFYEMPMGGCFIIK